MKKSTVFIIAAALLFMAAGCARYRQWQDRDIRRRYADNVYPDNPVPGLRTVGILVLDAAYRYPVDTVELTSALHTQLQQVTGLQVVPPGAVLEALQTGEYLMPRDGMRLADDLGLDGLFVAIVTQYDPYGEPVVGMGLTLFSRATPTIARMDLDRVIQGGRDLHMPTEQGAKPVTAVFAVYDSCQQNVRQRLKWFADGQTAGEIGMGWERYLRTMPNYMRFVSYEIVWSLFVRLQYDVGVRREPVGDE